MAEVPSRLLDVNEAQQRLLKQFAPVGIIRTPLVEAEGRVLAEGIVAEMDLPPFDNSAMDGFAVLVSDLAQAAVDHPALLDVVADIPAGKVVDICLQKGQAARIMTGAAIPLGAEAVVPVEDTDFNNRQPGVAAPAQVGIFHPVLNGDNIRPAGQDIHQGDVVISPGRRLHPQDLGLLSMLGVALVPVYQQPRVAIFSTGDELVTVDEPLSPGKIRDANSIVLASLVKKYGAEPVSLGIVPDKMEDVRACFQKAVAQKVDLILSSAGVSVGAFDYVRMVVEQDGRLDFWRVNMRPGKPLAFGEFAGIPFIGLPGNPVSAYVGFEVFVRPALLKMLGWTDLERSASPALLLEAVESDGRESYLRAVVVRDNENFVARLTGHQGSGNLRSLVQANALVRIPSGVRLLPAGSIVQVWMFDEIC